jgi:suppressor of ftsI
MVLSLFIAGCQGGSLSGLEKISSKESLEPLEPSSILEGTLLSADMVLGKLGNKEVKLFAYNKQIPGPLIKAVQGETRKINFTNNIDMPTTVHWHGLRLENQYDGVPGLTQEEVQSGDSFEYILSFPDAGMFWYHPHVREDYQQELGLYGMILVEPKENYYNQVDREEVLVLDDILLGEKSTFQPNDITNALMGRFGTIMLVNGKESYDATITKGNVIRYYISNVANTRVFNLSFEGASMKVIGSDASTYETEFLSESVVISPSERYIIEVFFPHAGKTSLVHRHPEKEYSLGSIIVSDNIEVNEPYPASSKDFFNLHSYNDTIADIAQYESYFNKSVDLRIKLDLTLDHEMDMGEMHSEDIEWEDGMPIMSDMTNNSLQWNLIDQSSGKKNMDIDAKYGIGDIVKIRLFNDPNGSHPMQHPIHFHGNRFLVLEENQIPITNKVWKDTVLVKTGHTVDILLEITNPGEWMAHCHIAEHLQSGMMMSYEVVGE